MFILDGEWKMKVNVATSTDCCCYHQRRQAASCLFPRRLQGTWHLQRVHKRLPFWQLQELDLEEVPEGQRAHTISTQQHCHPSCQPVYCQEFSAGCCHCFGVQSWQRERRHQDTGSRDNQKCRVLKDEGERNSEDRGYQIRCWKDKTTWNSTIK